MPKDTSAKELASKLFSKSEVQNKIAINAVKLIIGDIVTLYGEFRKAEGLGALFFNPSEPNKSTYLTIDDIKKDIILAEEIMDDDLKDFLNKLLNVIDREQEQGTCVVVMVTTKSMSVHVIDLNTVEEQIKELADAFSNN